MQYFVLGIVALAGFFGSASEYFPKDYESSRMRFLSWSKSFPNADMDSFNVPSDVDFELNLDTIYLPPSGSRESLVVIVSGVHGPEGYAGSAVQEMFLKEYYSHLDSSKTGVLLVHAVNPYGFKYHRRATENNVNMNRNLGMSPEMFQHKNKAYDNLAELLNPVGPVDLPLLSFLDTGISLVVRLVTGETLDELNEAIGGGQYEHPKGLQFGGKDFEPQTLYLQQLYGRIFNLGWKNIYFFDVHTGLGEAGELHVMSGTDLPTAVTEQIDRMFGAASAAGHFVLTNGDSEGFFHVYGDMIDFAPMMAPESTNVLAFTLEFGTLGNGVYSKLQTVNRLILENQGHHYGYTSWGCEDRVKQRYLELFYPQDSWWRGNVLSKSRAFFQTLFREADL